jgi:hypothetical protein
MNMTKLPDRESIPSEVKRALRQEAGFGCCKCGNPIYQYHHIVPRSSVLQDLMILCPNCHHEATIGVMSEPEQRTYKNKPFNVGKGYAEGTLKLNQSELVINVGTNQFIGDGYVVAVDKRPLLSIGIDEDNRITLSVSLYDREDNLLALIEQNEWISGDPFPWDVEFSVNWIRIRKKHRNIILEIDARKFPINIYADLWREKQNFQLSRDWIKFNGVIEDVGFKDICFVGLYLDADTTDKEFHIALDKRFREGKIVSESDLDFRVSKGLEEWRRIQADGISITKMGGLQHG